MNEVEGELIFNNNLQTFKDRPTVRLLIDGIVFVEASACSILTYVCK